MNVDKFLKICQKCKGACCKLGGTDFTKSEMLKVLKAGYPNYFVKINNNHYEMRSKKGICPYLNKDNSCLIHEIRPLACKSFPVYPYCKKNEKGFFLVKCPLVVKLSKKDIKTMKIQASRAKQIICTTFTDSKLPKSNLKLIEKRFNKFKIIPIDGE